MLEAHAAARGATSQLRNLGILGGPELEVTIGDADRVHLIARNGALTALATTQAGAGHAIAVIDSLEITLPERRELALVARQLLVLTLERWGALYETYPHAALDELRRTQPKARVLIAVTRSRAILRPERCAPGALITQERGGSWHREQAANGDGPAFVCRVLPNAGPSPFAPPASGSAFSIAGCWPLIAPDARDSPLTAP